MSNGPALHLLLHHTAGLLTQVRQGHSLTEALDALPDSVRPGTQALISQVMRWLGSAEAARAALAPKAPPPAVDAVLVSALALLWPKAEAPYAPHTVVDEAVTCMNQRQPRSAGFVNAVLRNFLRQQEAIVQKVQNSEEGCWNHPSWWIQRLRRDWPLQHRGILEAAQHRPPLVLRANPRKPAIALPTAPAVTWNRASRAGWPGRFGPEVAQAIDAPLPQAVWLPQPVPVAQIPGFGAGAWSVQDTSAQLAAPLLLNGLQPAGERLRLLDACAAPGGKTAHLLELCDADLTALDVDARRLRRVRETLQRLGLEARVVTGDGQRPETWWDGQLFDGILLDAPCSGSGIVRRHPDARWLRRPSDIPALAQVQSRLLDALWPLVRPGGHLLYATCSVFREEGQAQIDAFLQRHVLPDSVIDPRSPGHLLPLVDNPHLTGAQSIPACDGFFYALLRKPSATP